MERTYIENKNNKGWYYRAYYDKSGRRIIMWTDNINQAWSTDQRGVLKFMLKELQSYHMVGQRSLGV